MQNIPYDNAYTEQEKPSTMKKEEGTLPNFHRSSIDKNQVTDSIGSAHEIINMKIAHTK